MRRHYWMFLIILANSLFRKEMRFTKSMYESLSNSNILDEILMKEDLFFLPISTNIPDN